MVFKEKGGRGHTVLASGIWHSVERDPPPSTTRLNTPLMRRTIPIRPSLHIAPLRDTPVIHAVPARHHPDLLAVPAHALVLLTERPLRPGLAAVPFHAPMLEAVFSAVYGPLSLAVSGIAAMCFAEGRQGTSCADVTGPFAPGDAASSMAFAESLPIARESAVVRDACRAFLVLAGVRTAVQTGDSAPLVGRLLAAPWDSTAVGGAEG